MAMLVTYMLQSVLGVAVSGGSRIYKRGGHKIMDACCLYDHTFII